MSKSKIWRPQEQGALRSRRSRRKRDMLHTATLPVVCRNPIAMLSKLSKGFVATAGSLRVEWFYLALVSIRICG